MIQNSERLRIFTLMVMALIGFSGLTARLYYLQVFKAPTLTESTEKQRKAKRPVNASRGMIVDTNGRVLATNKNIYTVKIDKTYCDPKKDEDWRASVIALCAILKKSPEETQKHLDALENTKIISREIERNLEESDKELIDAHAIPGVDFDDKQARVYPEKSLASTIVGFTGDSNKGLSGIELAYNEKLKGQNIFIQQDKDTRRIIADRDTTKEVSHFGNDIVLTVDAYIQYVVERELKNAFEEYEASYVNAVVLDSKTSEVLAIAEYPTFDPNEYGKYPLEQRQPRILTEFYEPGSVIKPFTIVAALEQKVVTPNTMFFCENGRWYIHNRTLRDDIHEFKDLSVHDILVHSSNIGTVKIAQRLGNDYREQAQVLYDTFRRFGFRDRRDEDKATTSIGGETGGILNPPNEWQPAAISAVPYGQGMSTNTLKLAGAYNALANRGMYRMPQLVKGQRRGDGVFIPTNYEDYVRITDESNAESVVGMMVDVTEKPDGTGRNIRIPGFHIAGKTGTAQKAEPGKGYVRGLRIASFAGFFPAEDPEITIVVMVDEPKNKKYGGEVAGPAFKKIAEEIIAYKGITPTYKNDPKLVEKHLETNMDEGNSNIAYSFGTMKRLPVLTEEERNIDEGVMPNLIGLTKREAFILLAKQGLTARFAGYGNVITQEIQPGEAIGDRDHAGVLVCETALSDPTVQTASDLLAQR
jgi:cell division protein FtsI (penicillin-binding protein 3)